MWLGHKGWFGSLADGPLGGAAFTIHLPGRTPQRESAIISHRNALKSLGATNVVNL